jgi:peptide/nickel transport system permease protein
LLWFVLWELVGVSLLVGFVLILATMPPVQVTPAPAAPAGYTVKVDTRAWKEGLRQYVATIRSGSLGRDRHGHPVGPLVAQRLVNSLKLMAIALTAGLVLGLIKGVWDFMQLRRGGLALGPMVTGLVQGLPDFWLIMICQYGVVWSTQRFGFSLFPAGWMDEQPVASMVLPVLCLALVPWAYMARITSTALLSVWQEDYIRTARAKGLSDAAVIFRHAMANAINQILESLPNTLAVMFSNLLMVEYLYRYPGVTILLKDAVNPLSSLRQSRLAFMPEAVDTPVVVAAGLSLGLIFALTYLLVTLLRRVVDPRLRGGAGT